jgi:predicted MPP superfamily phosphohydrolase
MRYMKIRVLIVSVIVFIIAITTMVYDSTHGALTRLNVEKITLNSSEIPEVFNEMTLIYFSDLHAFTLSDAYYQSVINKINALNPDFVVFGGDLIDEGSYTSYSESERKALIALFKSIKAPYGKYAILSELDLNHQTELQALYLEAGFEVLNSKLIPIHVLGESKINFLGWDELSSSDLLSGLVSSDYTVAFAYDPDASSALNGKNVDVLFTGKTHGGQVTLPLIGPLFMKSEIHQKGLTHLSTLDLYVSTGIGVSNLKARWLTDPSITLITFKNN